MLCLICCITENVVKVLLFLQATKPTKLEVLQWSLLLILLDDVQCCTYGTVFECEIQLTSCAFWHRTNQDVCCLIVIHVRMYHRCPFLQFKNKKNESMTPSPPAHSPLPCQKMLLLLLKTWIFASYHGMQAWGPHMAS